MPQLVRFGCAGVSLIIIAALTSVGLYAVLTGGSPFGGAVSKPVIGGAQVLVTIQAGQPTATPPSAITPTPASGPVSGPAGSLAAPAAVAATPGPTPTATPTPVPASAPPSPAPPPGAGGPAASPPAPVRGTPSGLTGQQRSGPQATHDGLTAEIVEVVRDWQPADAIGAPIRVRDGHELLTIQVRLTNAAVEPRYVADADFALATEDGARYAPRASAPQREPRLLTLPLLTGDSVRGWLTFETPAGIEARRVQWSPTRPDRPRAEATYNLLIPR